jgi:hypothetical protein
VARCWLVVNEQNTLFKTNLAIPAVPLCQWVLLIQDLEFSGSASAADESSWYNIKETKEKKK